jgi:hypothetical protein
MVHVEECVAFKCVELEEVLGGGAERGVVLLEMGDRSEFDEEGRFEEGEVGSGQCLYLVQVLKVVHDVSRSDIE